MLRGHFQASHVERLLSHDAVRISKGLADDVFVVLFHRHKQLLGQIPMKPLHPYAKALGGLIATTENTP